MNPARPSKRSETKPSTTLPFVLGTVSLVAAVLLLFGAFMRTGLLGDANPVWGAWTSAPALVRFLVVSAVLLGLFGAGSAALTITWKRQHYLDILAASSFLVAGIAFIIGATTQPQYGASNAMPMMLGVAIAAGFVATLLSAWKRVTPKGKAGESGPTSKTN